MTGEGIQDPYDFEGRTVIVTGAGKGIGYETAKLLAERGASIVAISRTKSDLEALADETGARTIIADLASVDEVISAANSALPADHLVNNAGTNILQTFLDTDPNSFDHIQAVNVRAPLLLTQVFARHRIEGRGGGSIVNVSSMSSYVGFKDHAAYCASKGALDAMSRVMANELGEYGIRVNCINPIITMTELAADAWSDPEKSGPVLERIPVGRFAEPVDIAEAIAYLLSDASAMLNGLAIPIDGGFLTR